MSENMMQKKPLKLYLAHNLDTRFEIRKLELKIEKHFNVELLNPFYDTDRKDIKDIDNGVVTRWELSDQQCIDVVKGDLALLDTCDGLFTIVASPSFGTAFEIARAYATKKDIFIVSKKFINHPWIRVYSNHRYKNLREFTRWLKDNGYAHHEGLWDSIKKIFA